MEMKLEMTKEEMVSLYGLLSSEYNNLDPQLRNTLYNLEKVLFSNLTISEIEALQSRSSGDV